MQWEVWQLWIAAAIGLIIFEVFVNDFVAAWTKVMNLDRFDLLASN